MNLLLCQECGNKQASLHFTKIVQGEKTEFHLCDACAREKGDLLPGTPNGFSIHHLLSGLMDFEPTSKSGADVAQQSKEIRCENCGLTYAQFAKLGKFGCSSCYEYFAPGLDPILKRVHGNTVHVGKIPKRAGGVIQKKRELLQLKKELERCIDQEEFERAADLRDRIREMETKISG